MRIIAGFISIIFTLLAGATATAQDSAEPIKVACGSVGIELKLCTDAVEAWTAKTGYPASVVSMPTSSSERLALYQQFLSAKQGGIDVFQIDVIWPGILKTHLLDLTPYVPQEEVKQHYATLIHNNTVDGRLVALPYYTDVGVMYYRKDLLEKYDLAVPQTWDEMTEAAKIIQKGEREAGIHDFWGYVWQGKAYEGLTCNALEWVYSSGGGQIVAPEGDVTIVNDDAANAINRAAGWVGSITPRGVLNYSEEEARGIFQSGKAAFMRNWPYAWSLAQGEGSPVKGKVGVTMMLHEGGDTPRSGALGGWQMAVSKYSAHKEKAVDLVRYLTGPEVQRKLAIESSNNPTIRALYDEPDVLAALAIPEVLKEALGAAVARPSRVAGVRYNQLSNGFYNAVHATLSDDGTAEENLKSLQHRLKRISKEGTWD